MHLFPGWKTGAIIPQLPPPELKAFVEHFLAQVMRFPHSIVPRSLGPPLRFEELPVGGN